MFVPLLSNDERWNDLSDKNAGPGRVRRFLCKENHALDAWFKVAYWYKKFDYTITGYND